MFYNVENLFDTINDPHANDEEFLPNSKRNWNSKRFYKKINNLYKVIAETGEWTVPDFIGFAEVENRFCIEALIKNSPLYTKKFSVIHFDSNDPRGIDVAAIYNPKTFSLIESRKIVVKIKADKEYITRDILYAKGFVNSVDTFHIFVNHWPSRRGGKGDSEFKRISAAKTLRHSVDSIFKKNSSAKIVIMGDFNDHPYDKSIREYLAAIYPNNGENIENVLYNMSAGGKGQGTYYYKGKWEILDQFIVSGGLLKKYNETKYKIIDADFLLDDDEKYMNKKPHKTYNSINYSGGYSDHLPIRLSIPLN